MSTWTTTTNKLRITNSFSCLLNYKGHRCSDQSPGPFSLREKRKPEEMQSFRIFNSKVAAAASAGTKRRLEFRLAVVVVVHLHEWLSKTMFAGK